MLGAIVIMGNTNMPNTNQQIHSHIIGIDEAGRGPLAGPVAVGAVAVQKKFLKDFISLFRGIKDSKKLSAQKREIWFRKLKTAAREGVLSFHVSFSSAGVIDRSGINYAISHSIASSLGALKCPPANSLILLDGGLRAPKQYKQQKTIVRGDEKVMIISLASIAAKVLRDRQMEKFSQKYPCYGFEQHKGYGTVLHMKNIRKYGASKIHRRSFLKNTGLVKHIKT